jgi:hypothetical protein
MSLSKDDIDDMVIFLHELNVLWDKNVKIYIIKQIKEADSNSDGKVDYNGKIYLIKLYYFLLLCIFVKQILFKWWKNEDKLLVSM